MFFFFNLTFGIDEGRGYFLHASTYRFFFSKPADSARGLAVRERQKVQKHNLDLQGQLRRRVQKEKLYIGITVSSRALFLTIN